MEANSIDNFINGLKDFHFSVLEDFFPDISREELDKVFDETVELKKEN